MDTDIIDTPMHIWDPKRFECFWLKPESGILYKS